MNKNLITKIFIAIFTMGISFVGLNNVFAASKCSTADDAARPTDVCKEVGADGFGCRSNPVSPYELCRSAGCQVSNASLTWYNNNKVTDSLTALVGGVKDNHDKFVGYFEISALRDYNSARAIQQTINIVHKTMPGCGPVCEDGRFGNNTIGELANCIPCSARPENAAKRDYEKLYCENGATPDNNGCCKVVECTTEITVTPNSYNEGDELEVEVKFNSPGNFKEFNGNLNITYNGGSISTIIPGIDCNFPFCRFWVKPDTSSSEVVITVPEGKAILEGGDKCSAATKTIKKNIACPGELKEEMSMIGGCCMPKNKWSECDNSVALGAISPDNDLSTLTSSYKCKLDNIEREFCSCNDPADGGCPDGWANKDGCCEECGENETPGEDGCSCDEESLKCAENDEKKDPNSCKCVCDSTKQCCGIELNTVVPFIGDCIEMTSQNNTADPNDPNTSRVNQLNAFPFLMMGMSKILVTVILVFSFLIVIAAGLMMVTGVYEEGNYKKGMERIKKVVVALILLGSSGLILRLINPTFFGG